MKIFIIYSQWSPLTSTVFLSLLWKSLRTNKCLLFKILQNIFLNDDKILIFGWIIPLMSHNCDFITNSWDFNSLRYWEISLNCDYILIVSYTSQLWLPFSSLTLYLIIATYRNVCHNCDFIFNNCNITYMTMWLHFPFNLTITHFGQKLVPKESSDNTVLYLIVYYKMLFTFWIVWQGQQANTGRPSSWSNIVTLFGSPLKAWIFSLIHRSAWIWSNSP